MKFSRCLPETRGLLRRSLCPWPGILSPLSPVEQLDRREARQLRQ